MIEITLNQLRVIDLDSLMKAAATEPVYIMCECDPPKRRLMITPVQDDHITKEEFLAAKETLKKRVRKIKVKDGDDKPSRYPSPS